MFGDTIDTIFFLAGFLSITTYLIPILAQTLYFDWLENDLKKKYNAKWGLVTGASSGIGFAIAEKLLSQGINVVMVALDDKLLEDSHKDLKKRFPKLQLRKIGVNLAVGDYMTPIIEGTADIKVQLVFNNAGFITCGMLHKTPLSRNVGNLECNATSAVKITHHFIGVLTEANLKGLIAFTSSSACFMPNPLGALYASTKAFMTLFATSVAAEVKSLGIDVVVVHPSPMATNFFDTTESMGVLQFFKKFANKPSVIADVIFSNAGRFVVRDQGLITILLRLMLKFLDLNFMVDIATRTAHMSGDYHKQHSNTAGKKE